MTQQEVFDAVWDHFLTRNHPPGWDGERKECTYGDPQTGARCAVGIFFGPEVCLGEMNDLGSLIRVAAYLPPGVREVGMPFLSALQDAHDSAAPAQLDDHGVPVQSAFHADLRDRLGTIAMKYGLVVPQ